MVYTKIMPNGFAITFGLTLSQPSARLLYINVNIAPYFQALALAIGTKHHIANNIRVAAKRFQVLEYIGTAVAYFFFA